MLKFIRNTYLNRFIIIAITFAIINTAIDPPDLMQNMDNDFAFEEDLSVNEIESIVELVMEKGMDMKDAIPESDDSDSEDFCKKMEINVFLVTFLPVEFYKFESLIIHQTRLIQHFSCFSHRLESPPPKA
jgi:hypothetical protein